MKKILLLCVLAFFMAFVMASCKMFTPLGGKLLPGGDAQEEPEEPGNPSETPWGAPQNVAAVSGLIGRIELSWSPVKDAEYYLVYFSRDANSGFSIPGDEIVQGSDRTVPLQWTLFKSPASPMDSGEVYYFRVRAVNNKGEQSPFSEFAVAGCMDAPLIAVPVLRPGSVVLRWSLPNLAVVGVDYPCDFTVLRQVDGEDFTEVAASSSGDIEEDAGAFSFENAGVDPEMLYRYKVQIRVPGHEGFRESAAYEITTLPQAYPHPVNNLVAGEGVDSDKVVVSWDAPDPLPDYAAYDLAYTVVRRSPEGVETVLADKMEGPTTFTDDDAADGPLENTVYEYSVVPFFVLGVQQGSTVYSYGGNASEVQGYRLWVPGDMEAQSQGGSVELSWVYPDDKMSGVTFRLHREEYTVGGEDIVIANSLTETDFSDTGAEAAKTYYYRVEAVKGSQETRSVRTAEPVGYAPPAEPLITDVQVSQGRTSDITLEWGGVTEADYSIFGNDTGHGYTSGDKLAENLEVNAEGKVQFTDTQPPGTVRYYRIEASKDGNEDFTLPQRGYVLGIPSELEVSQGEFKDKIHVGWTAVEGAEAYRLFYRPEGSSDEFEVLADDLVPVNPEQPAGDFFPPGNGDPEIRGRGWELALRAVKDEGGEEQVSDASASVVGCTLGPALVNLRAARGQSVDKVTLEWDAVTGAETYDVYRNVEDDAATAVRILQGVSGTTAEDEDTFNLMKGVGYYYYIRPLRANVPSNISSLPAFGFIVSPPAGCVADNYASSDSISLSWDEHPEEAAGGPATYFYNVYKKDGENWLKVDSTAVGQTNYTFPLSAADISSGQVEKEFKITSEKSGGQESLLPAGSCIGSALSRPMGVAASQGDGSLMDASGSYYTRLFWTAVPGAEIYRVERMDDRDRSSGGWVELGTVAASAGSDTVEFQDFTALTLENLYQSYRVRCERGSGSVTTLWSDEAQGYRQITAEEFLNMVNFTLRRSMAKLFYNTGTASGSLQEGSVGGDVSGTYTHGIDRDGFFSTNYRRYYAYTDYRDYFLTLNGSFMKDNGGGVPANSRPGDYRHRDPEDTPVLTVSGPYSGTVRFENVHVENNDGNNPGWNSGHFVVEYNGSTAYFDHNSGVPIQYFMSESHIIAELAQ